MINNFIDVAKGFQTSVNIAYDLYNNDRVCSFIPTASSLDVIEDVLLSTASKSSQRARILIGAYGRGKSHIVLVLMSLLFKKDKALFENLLAKMKVSNKQLFEFTREYIESDKKLLPIIVRGSSTSLTQSFFNALQQALNSENLSGLMPETHFEAAINTIHNWRECYPDTYYKFIKLLDEPIEQYILKLKEFDVSAYDKFCNLYPELTSGSIFNPLVGFDIVDLFESITEKVRDKGYNGIYIIYDEFSKYLESSIAHATMSDIKLLQDLAEKCDRSGSQQMHLMLICHKDIANYIDNNLPKEKVDGWRGVSGRFRHIHLHNNFSQMYEIISSVIKKSASSWREFYNKNASRFDDLTERFTKNMLFDSDNKDEVQNIIMGCYPLHPISTFILPRLSEKVAQNERTLFTFLSADDKYTLSAFLRSAEGEFPMLTPDYIYDYFEPLLRKEPYTTETYKLYKLTSSVLRKVDTASLEAKIIKAISLIYIIEQFEKLPPIYDVIVEMFQESVGDRKLISKALKELIKRDCIVYLKRSNNYLKLKESSGIDIPREIADFIEKNKATLNIKDILNQSSFDSFMYPTRYNDENEIIRYFDFYFIYSREFWEVDNWELKISSSQADGMIYAIIPSNQEEIKKIQESLLSGKHNHKRIVFILPKEYNNIEKIALEYAAVKHLKSLVVDDELLSDEYDIYIEDLSEVIDNFIFSYTHPESGCSNYFYKGEKQQIYRKAQLSDLLSRICEETFPHTPIINNESINKNFLPTVAINSRTRLLAGLLKNELEPNLGLTGTGQDVSIMRSTLIQTGILLDVDNTPRLELNPEDDKIRNVLNLIQSFFIGANVKGGRCFKELYDQLTMPEHGIGMKCGVIPIFIAVVLHHYKKNMIIKHNNTEEKITPNLLNDINENPQDYSIILENWSEEKAEFIKGLETIFSEFIIEREKAYNSFTYIVLAMKRWYMSLPKYTKEIEHIYCGKNSFKPISKSKKRFINSLKQINNNPREYLFEKIFSIFGMNNFSIDLLDNIKNTKYDFDNMVPSLIDALCLDVKDIFAINKHSNASLASVIKDWYESLNERTLQHLFDYNENHILDLMATITNDEHAFIQRLAKAFTYLRIEDWNSDTIQTFLSDLRVFKETIEEFDKNCLKEKGIGSEYYKIVFTSSSGEEYIRSFSKTDYSAKAKLLLNEITTALEDMGQAITQQEKRQVLMDLLETLC